jgi:anthranilate synthase component 2
MIIIIDNQDSFVWNLAEYVSLFDRVKVLPNTTKLAEMMSYKPDGIIISPGPGNPYNRRDTGNCEQIILESHLPVLGICMGHQIIAKVFGGEVRRIQPVHGKSAIVKHDGRGVLKNVSNPLRAGRYHSLAVTKIPRGFEISAVSEDGIVMGIRSKKEAIEGLQFHPESILTDMEDGLRIIRNFVEIAGCLK